MLKVLYILLSVVLFVASSPNHLRNALNSITIRKQRSLVKSYPESYYKKPNYYLNNLNKPLSLNDYYSGNDNDEDDDDDYQNIEFLITADDAKYLMNKNNRKLLNKEYQPEFQPEFKSTKDLDKIILNELLSGINSNGMDKNYPSDFHNVKKKYYSPVKNDLLKEYMIKDLIKNQYSIVKRGANNKIPKSSMKLIDSGENIPNQQEKVSQDLKELFSFGHDAENKSQMNNADSKKSNDNHNHFHSNKNKKSIDWSEYFGIDKRNKEILFIGTPKSSDNDEEWMIKQYYKIMGSNLLGQDISNSNLNSKFNKYKNVDKNFNEKRNKIVEDSKDEDEKVKNIKNLIMKDPAKYLPLGNNLPQSVKDMIMTRLVNAYSMKKMQKALNKIRNNTLIYQAQQQQQQPHFIANENKKFIYNNYLINSTSDKDTIDIINDDDVDNVDESNDCPIELKIIEKSCEPTMTGFDKNNLIFKSCVSYQICKLCNDERECTQLFAKNVFNICDNYLSLTNIESLEQCKKIVLVMLQIQLTPITNHIFCHENNNYPCLYHYQKYYIKNYQQYPIYD